MGGEEGGQGEVMDIAVPETGSLTMMATFFAADKRLVGLVVSVSRPMLT